MEQIDHRYKESMLTTLDNPFNPFTQYEEWNAFDIEKGYDTSAYLARIVYASDELSEQDESLAISEAISEILELNITGNYVAVTKDSFKDRSNSMV